MKYIINKLQGGGALSAPTSYITYTSNQPQVAGSMQGQVQRTELIDDDMFKKIMENSLTSDAMLFFNKINEIESDPAVALGFRSKNMALQTEIIQMFNNKKNYESAKQVAKENGTLDEVAMGSYGGIYVMDRNRNIKEISTKDYATNKDIYKPLTVSELLIARNDNPKLANDENVFSVAEGNVSLDKVMSKIDNIIKESAKSSEEREYNQPYSTKMQGIEGFDKLQEIMKGQPEGLYKTGQKDSAVLNAENYIWSSLTVKERQRLELENSINGLPGTKGSDIVHNAILSRSAAERKIEPTTLKAIKGEGEEGVSGSTTITATQGFVQGLFPTGDRFNWNDPQTGLTLSVPVTGAMKLLDYQDRPLGMIKLSELNNAKIGFVSDTQHISFGNSTLSDSDKNGVVISDDDAYRVYLPVKADGSANLDKLKEVQEINENLLARKNKGEEITPEKMNDAYKNLGIFFDSNYNMISGTAKPFVITYGYTTDAIGDVINRDNKDKFVQKIGGGWFGHGGEEAELEDRLKDVYARTEDKKNKGAMPTSTFLFGGESWYKGIVAIPLKPNASIDIAMLENKLYQPKSTVEQGRINASIRDASTLTWDASIFQNK